jgi:hypothetical protein
MTFMRAYRLYRSNFDHIAPTVATTTSEPRNASPTEAGPSGLSFPTEVVTDIRAVHDIFTRLAARGDICDEIWETVGLLMTTSAGRLAESALSLLPIDIESEPFRGQIAAPVIAALHRGGDTAVATSAVAAPAATESPTSPPLSAGGVDASVRQSEDDGGEDYHSMLMALERSNRELLRRTRNASDGLASVSNLSAEDSARRQ